MSIAHNHIEVEPLNKETSLYLDILRILLSQAVLIGHSASYFGIMAFLHPPNFPWIQSIAVLGFFWLSGFLICHSTLLQKQKNRPLHFSHFLVDRASRIYSGYIPAILFVSLMDLLFIKTHPENYGFYDTFSLSTAIKNFFMLQKFPFEPMLGSASTWWTLAIEWWLYMFFGWFFVKRRPLKIQKMYHLCFLVIFLLLLPLHFYAEERIAFLGFGLSFIWFLACGTAIFKDAIGRMLRGRAAATACIFFAVITPISYKITSDAYNILAAVSLGAAFLFSICWFQQLNFEINPRLKKLVHFFAAYSFTLFLTHYSILYFIYANGILDGRPAFFISFAASNIAAALIAICSEMHYKKISNHIKTTWLSTQKNCTAN